MTRYAYGRLAAIHPVGLGLIGRYLRGVPDAPATFDHTNGWNGFKMLGNGPDPTLTISKPVGDCGVVGTVDVSAVDAVETGEAFSMPDANTVVAEYLRYDHGQDKGVALVQFLEYWRQAGLPWAKAPVGWGTVDHRDLDALWAYTNAFGCAYVGIAVPAAAEQQAAAGEPWDLTGTEADEQIVGGHCVVIVSRDSDGGEVATWGKRQRFTTRWWQTYGEEAHVVVTAQQAARHGDGYGIDEEKLVAALDRLHSEPVWSVA